MKKARSAIQSRSRLDQRFEQIGPPSRFVPPVRGWIRAIRSALGMTSAQLADRLGIKQPSVVALEQSEAKGTIELATLHRVAEALDAKLVYALVPNKTLESMVRDRARQRLAPLEHSMRLEDQGLGRKDSEAQLDEFVRTLNPSRLWDDR
jgi:predicted DNA-binding mobile mystery protein A